jgi:hypothetical protein
MKSQGRSLLAPQSAVQWKNLLPLAAASLTPSADAAGIYTAVGINVGAGGSAPSQVSSLVLDLPGINDLQFSNGVGGGITNYVRGLIFSPAPGGTYVSTPRNLQNGVLGAYAFVASTATAGQTVDDPSQTSRGPAIIGGQDVTYSTFYSGSFTDRYLTFSFNDSTSGGALRYGWVSLDFTLTNRNNFNGHIKGYAYDNSGAKLPAGTMPTPASVPEPGTAGASLLLGAMITGAVGVRRRRKAMSA